MVILNFDSCAQIWVNAIVISLIVGIALNASVEAGQKKVFQRIRLFLIPFAVSSYTGLIRGKDFILIFPPDWQEVLIGLIVCSVVVVGYGLLLSRKET